MKASGSVDHLWSKHQAREKHHVWTEIQQKYQAIHHPSNWIRKAELQSGIPGDSNSKAVTHHKISLGAMTYGFTGWGDSWKCHANGYLGSTPSVMRAGASCSGIISSSCTHLVLVIIQLENCSEKGRARMHEALLYQADVLIYSGLKVLKSSKVSIIGLPLFLLISSKNGKKQTHKQKKPTPINNFTI